MTEILRLIHYGSKVYKPDLVQPIKNDWVKPNGGLWASPVDSLYGWRDWCQDENFRECKLENSFTIQLIDGVKIFKIDSLKDLNNAPFFSPFKIAGFEKRYLNYEMLALQYDAIWLSEKGQNETRFSMPLDLYGWDCETVLIMKPECCFQVSTTVTQ